MNRLHPLSAVTMAINRGFLGLFAAFALVSAAGALTEFASVGWTTVAAPLGFLIGGTYGIVYYLRYEYEVTEDTFDVSSGVVSRRSREIPYRRIQNVDVRQGVIQRLLGLAIVSIETAGGGDTEAVLNFVSNDEATRLQQEIRRRTADATDASKRRQKRGDESPVEDRPRREAAETNARTPPEETTAGRTETSSSGESPSSVTDTGRTTDPTDSGELPEPTRESETRQRRIDRPKRLFELQSRELLLYSFTSFRPAAAAAVLFFVFLAFDPIIDHLVSVSQPVGGPEDLETGTAGSYGVLTIVSFVYAVAVTYLVSVAYTFGTYYDFQLSRAGRDFVYERGLLQKYSGSIPSEKIQSVTVTDNPLQRLINYAGMWIETAGYGPESSSGSQSAVPLARQGRVYTFTERLTGTETPRFASPPPLARRRYLARYSIIAGTFVAFVFGISLVTALEAWYVAAVVFVGVPPAAHLRYINLGYYVGEDHLIVRRGFWRRRTTVIPYYRLQTVSTRRSVFQRRLGLASLVVDTASSRSFFWTTPTIYDLELADAREVHMRTRKRLQSALRERSRSDETGLSVDFT